jgi:putative transcriptional regulator
VSLAVACHATLCGRCQGEIDHLEAAAGAALETGHGLAVREGLRDDVLARLDDAEPPAPPATAPASAEAAATLMLPRPLLRYLDRAGGLRWKLRLPGVHVVDLSEAAHSAAGAVARLVRFRPGLTIPLHGHGGPEYTVVFTGAFDDAGLTYARGDVCVRDASERHVQRILPGEDCVVLAVNEGPLIPLTWLGKLMRFVGERRVRSLEK